MEAYTGFAQVYDTFMDDTPYEAWCAYLVELLEKHRDNGTEAAPAIENDNCVMNENLRQAYNAVPAPGCGTGGAENQRQQDQETKEAAGENDNLVTKENLQQEQNTILDLGCGTGTLTELLARRGYDMIGIDNAADMLEIALDKRTVSGLDILYLQQDMRDFELYGTVGAVVSVCDSVNYLLEEEDVVQTFRLVNNYLYPEGLFIFDFNTVYKYKEVIGDVTIAENREACSFIWDNYYHEAEEVNEYDLTIFVRENGQTDTYRRFQETHYQRGYRLEQMKAYLGQAGLAFVEAVDADTHGAVTDTSERIYVVARECGKRK